MSDPLVTVAVSTYNRAASLGVLLDALAAQTLAADQIEVVVVDDASTDGTPELLAARASNSPFRLTHVRLDRNRGQSAGRNTAWRRGCAAIVAFTDDDCRPTPGWLAEGLRAMDEPCVLVGATEPDPAQRDLLDPLARTMRVHRPTFTPTCNVFYRREDLEAVGGFDERYGGLAGEDTDLGWRVHGELGRPLRFSAEALVYHDVRPRTFAKALADTKRWAGIGAVVARHPRMSSDAWPGRFLRPSHPRALLALAGVVLAFVFPPFVLLTLPWLRYAIFTGRPSVRWLRFVRFVPAVFAVDLSEVLVLAKTSIKHRTWIL